MITKIMIDLLRFKFSGSVILFLATFLAIFVANSGFVHLYSDILAISLPLDIPWMGIYKDLDLKMWINDGLMAIFFLLVGLELKREVIQGELSSKAKIILPLFAAIGGVIVPAIIYYYINFNHPENLRGWAIPTATDIAFAIGVLNLFGNKISNSLKIFLVALAVLDDLAAILIITFFYSADIEISYLVLALGIIIFLVFLNKIKITNLTPYLLAGSVLWVLVLKSGIHPTIAGVILAFLIPIKIKNKNNNISPLETLEKNIYFLVSYLILPIFAFANSGIIFDDISSDIWREKIFLSVVLALFFGKQIGVALMVFLLTKLKISPFFKSSWPEFYGVAVLTGIGFTMSLFIGNLAFPQDEHLFNEIRAGVIAGSLLSGIVGFLIIHFSLKKKYANN